MESAVNKVCGGVELVSDRRATRKRGVTRKRGTQKNRRLMKKQEADFPGSKLGFIVL